MRSIALIHTVKSVAVSFDAMLKESLGEDIKVHNLWDDFLANNPNEIGEFTVENRNRLFMDMKAQELTGADLIVTTCSTLTPVVEMIRPFIKIPVIAIDDNMAKKSVTFGSRVMVMATAESTIGPTVSKIQGEAGKAGREVSIDTLVAMDAFQALKAMDMETHDRILKERAGALSGYDCIVLAQASMAHLEEEIGAVTGCPVLTSPKLCMEEIREKLGQLK
ncbi:MAG: aspartate/glutamate racemase family protein [Clostridium sp.]|nr:aspartate/glutamate racemase family protein [Clostridium sp.]